MKEKQEKYITVLRFMTLNVVLYNLHIQLEQYSIFVKYFLRFYLASKHHQKDKEYVIYGALNRSVSRIPLNLSLKKSIYFDPKLR